MQNLAIICGILLVLPFLLGMIHVRARKVQNKTLVFLSLFYDI